MYIETCQNNNKNRNKNKNCVSEDIHGNYLLKKIVSNTGLQKTTTTIER